jgi:death-on-curing protein
METNYLEVEEVVQIHERILHATGGSSGLRDRGALESAVYRPRTGYYADLIEEAGALLESLVRNHPFVDGNKRTAFVCAGTFLRLTGLRIRVEEPEAEKFFLESLTAGTFRFPVIRDWLREITAPFES